MSKPLASREARGYGVAHRRMRKQWERIVTSGEAVCARCEKPIEAAGPWDLGHNADRTAWTGPEHVACNRSAGGANGAAAMHRNKQTIRRDW